jgi:hypothetical protein
MRRVRSSALVKDAEGRLSDPAGPFSGLAYPVDDEGRVGALAVVEEGIVTGSSEDWLVLPEGGSRIDRSKLEIAEDYGPLLAHHAPFTGVVYAFDRSGACVAEEACVAGYPTEEARTEWYASGALRARVRGEEGAAWFEDGRLQAKGVGDAVQLNLVTGDDGRLQGLVLGDAGLLDLASVERLTFADELSLIGPAIDTALLTTLSRRTALAEVPRLRLIETGAGPEVVDLLVTFARLTTLWLSKNPALRPDDAQRMRTARPDCTVHYQEPDEE